MTDGEKIVRYVVDRMGITRADIAKITSTHVHTLNRRQIPHGLAIMPEWSDEIKEAIRLR